MATVEDEKRLAAEASAELVEDGMTVGLGTGSTVAYLLPALARRKLNLRCVATSPRTEKAATELGLRVEPFDTIDRFDMTIDGADQIAPDGWLVKGGGAATREARRDRGRSVRGHRRLLEAGAGVANTGATRAARVRPRGDASPPRERDVARCPS
jgi:hypothetical protein